MLPDPPACLPKTIACTFLLRPEQAGWIRAHARGNASRFMRRLIHHLIEEELNELQRFKDQLTQSRQGRNRQGRSREAELNQIGVGAEPLAVSPPVAPPAPDPLRRIPAPTAASNAHNLLVR